jgi:hypothetical protein
VSKYTDTGAIGLISAGASAPISSAWGGPLMLAGSLLGFLGGGDEKDPSQELQEQINAILNQGLRNALGYSENYTSQAINNTKQFGTQAIDALTQYGTSAKQAATGAIMGGLQNYNTLNRPIVKTGYDALDTYKKTLGLQTEAGGSYNSVQNQKVANQLSSLLKPMAGNYVLGSAPTEKEFMDKISMDQIREYVAANTKNVGVANNLGQVFQHKQYTGAGWNSAAAQQASDRFWSQVAAGEKNPGYATFHNNYASLGYIQDSVKRHLSQQQFQQAQQAYTGKQNALQQVQSLLGSGVNISQLAPFLRGKI